MYTGTGYDPWSQQIRNMMFQSTAQNNPQMPLPQPQIVQIPTVKRYKGVEITEKNTQSTTDYVSKSEFKSLADKVNNLSSMINNSNNKGDKR